MPSNPPTLTPAQLEQYLKRSKYAEKVPSRNEGSPRLKHLRESMEQEPLAALK